MTEEIKDWALAAALSAAVAVAGVVSTPMGCNRQQQQQARTLLTVADEGCTVVERLVPALAPSSSATVEKVCVPVEALRRVAEAYAAAPPPPGAPPSAPPPASASVAPAASSGGGR